MAEETVKKVPVMDDLELVGIVTMTDIVWHFAELRKEASEMGEAYSRWKPR
jgi:CBS domain-containing protein